jgi:hypothetical protein
MSQAVAILRQVGPESDPGNSRGIHLQGLVFDATFREKHEIEAEITENPVETGVSVADHMFMKPIRVTISAGVSDVSFQYSKMLLADGKSPGTFVANPNDPFGGGDSRSRTAFDLLTQLQATFEPFNVQTGLKLYKNMVCKNITIEQDKDTSKAFIFEAELKEVIFVTTKSAITPPTKKGTNIKKPVQRGTVQAMYVTDQNKSISILNGIGVVHNPSLPIPPGLQ